LKTIKLEAEQPIQKPNCDVPTLWLEHKTALFHYILKRVKNQELAEELLQEVLLKVYQFCLSKNGVRNVRSWLFQIAHNTIIDTFRQQQKIKTTDHFPILAEENDPLAFEEALPYILPMIEFLPETYSRPLKLADIEGMKHAEVAKILGLSLTAAKSRIQRARQLLKNEFVTCCHFETDRNGNLISFDIKAGCAPLQALKEKK